MGITFVFFGLIAFGFTQYVIRGPATSNRGEWAQEFETCPEGLFVQGFQLQTEPSRITVRDKTSLNSIRLFCGNPSDGGVPVITSNAGFWGKWGSTFRCINQGYIIGFQLRVMGYSHVPLVDNVGASNFRAICSEQDGFIPGDGETEGKWSDELLCPMDTAVCALRTQIESKQGALRDDTALNNVELQCCSLPPTIYP